MKTVRVLALSASVLFATAVSAAPHDARCFRSSFLTPLDTVEFFLEHLNANKSHHASSALADNFDRVHKDGDVCEVGDEQHQSDLPDRWDAEAYKVHRQGRFDEAEVAQWDDLEIDSLPPLAVGDVDIDVEIYRADGLSDMNTFVLRQLGREWFIVYRYNWSDTADYYAADIDLDAEPPEDFRQVPEYDDPQFSRLFR